MGIKSKVRKWLEEGLIDTDQMEAILHYEKGTKPSLSYSLYGFLIVATVSASLGLIALITANWQIIPPFVKLGSYFLILASLSVYAIKTDWKSQSVFWSSSLLFFFMLLCLAGIGLIAQIYNIKGESYQTLFFWSFISLGLMLVSQGSLTLYLWFASLYTAIYLYLIEIQIDNHLLFKLILCQPLLFGFLSLLFHNQKAVELFPSLKFKRKVFEEGFLLTGILSLILFHTVSYKNNFQAIDFFLLVPASLIVLLGIYLSTYRKIQKKLLTSALFLFLLFYVLTFNGNIHTLGLMIFSSLFLALFAFFFATLKKKSIFTFLIFALIARILFFYITIFKSLTVTGLILLCSGFFIFMVVKWIKNNEQKWIKWIESLK